MTELSYLNEKQGKSKAGRKGLWHLPGQQMCPGIWESALSQYSKSLILAVAKVVWLNLHRH